MRAAPPVRVYEPLDAFAAGQRPAYDAYQPVRVEIAEHEQD